MKAQIQRGKLWRCRPSPAPCTCVPGLIVLCFIGLADGAFFSFFYKLGVWGDPAFIVATFQQQIFAHSVSVCHVLIILPIFQTFTLLFVISDLRSYCCHCFRFLKYAHFLSFPGGSDGKESICNAGDLGLIPESEDPLV